MDVPERTFRVDRDAARFGGVLTTAELHRNDVPKTMIEIFVGWKLFRIRRGWYGIPGLGDEVVRAVRVGGRVGCLSALAHHGEVPLPRQLHVAVRANAAGFRSPDDPNLPLDVVRDGVVLHWMRRADTGDRQAVGLYAARQQAAKCDGD